MGNVHYIVMSYNIAIDCLEKHVGGGPTKNRQWENTTQASLNQFGNSSVIFSNKWEKSSALMWVWMTTPKTNLVDGFCPAS